MEVRGLDRLFLTIPSSAKLLLVVRSCYERFTKMRRPDQIF